MINNKPHPLPEVGVEPIPVDRILADEMAFAPPRHAAELTDGMHYPVGDYYEESSEYHYKVVGWHRCMLRAIGLRNVVRYVGVKLWIDALEAHLGAGIPQQAREAIALLKSALLENDRA